MPRRRRIPNPATERAPIGTDDEIRERLDQFVMETFGSWFAFEDATGIPHATAMHWKSVGGPLPEFDSLRKIAEQGLSIDWLLTGNGSPMRRIGSTPVGAVLELMRGHLQKEAGVGHHSASQAFTKIAIRFGQEEMIRKAATGLQRDFDVALAEFRALEAHVELIGWANSKLHALEQAAQSGGVVLGEEILSDWRRQIVEHLPLGFRPGDLDYQQYWDAVVAGRKERLSRSLSMAARAEEIDGAPEDQSGDARAGAEDKHSGGS